MGRTRHNRVSHTTSAQHKHAHKRLPPYLRFPRRPSYVDARLAHPAGGCFHSHLLFSRSFFRQAVSNGFSLTVTLLNDTGKDTRTEEYYRGCKLVLRARALNKFTGLYVAGVSAEGLWEGFEVSLLVYEVRGMRTMRRGGGGDGREGGGRGSRCHLKSVVVV